MELLLCILFSILMWAYLFLNLNPTCCLHEHACFNNILELSCQKSHIIIIESSKLSKNNETIARACDTGYDKNCNHNYDEVIVKCSGRRSCRISNNEFQSCNDAFLVVEYSCIPVTNISQKCEEKVKMLDNSIGYISSPNYPKRYYPRAKCNWNIRVKKRQTIRIKMYDFKLNPKVENKCGDKLTLSPVVPGSTKPPEQLCSQIGYMTLNYSVTDVKVHFSSSIGLTLPKTGFILKYEAIGPGCDDLPELGNNTKVTYKMTQRAPIESHLGPMLSANVTCIPGFFTFVDNGEQVSKINIQCENYKWSHVISPCTDVLPEVTTLRKNGLISDDTNFQSSSKSSTYIGTVLGVVCSIISLLLLFSIIIYALRRRKKSNNKRDDLAIVNNDLQYSNQVNEMREHASQKNFYNSSNCSMYQKSYNYKCNKITNSDTEDTCCQYYDRIPSNTRCYEDNNSQCGSLVGHAAGIPNDCSCRRSSAADLLDDNSRCYTPVRNNRSWAESSSHSCPKPKGHWSDNRERPFRERRTKSGQWNRCAGGATISSKRSRSCEILDERRGLSSSAPDLINQAIYIPNQPNNQGYTSFHTPRKLFY